jgi:hypothetical protein
LKIKASILFFCLFTYITELAALPTYCKPVGEDVPACSLKSSCSPCKKPVQEEKKDTGSQNDCYLNCPLCYVMTMTSVAFPAKSAAINGKEYPLYSSNYIFIFCSTTWKPPNVS